MKKTPDVTKVNAGSLKILKSGRIELPGLGGSRERTRRMAARAKAAIMNPMIRVAHPNPILGISDWSIKGKTTPPIEPPIAAIPVAAPRLARKKWPIAEIDGVKMRDVPDPAIRPTTSMSCQYVSQRPSNKVAAVRRMPPDSISQNGPLASNTGPIWRPQKKAKKM